MTEIKNQSVLLIIKGRGMSDSFRTLMNDDFVTHVSLGLGLGSHTKSWVRFLVLYKLGKVRHSVNPSTLEADSPSRGSSRLHRKFEDNLDYMISGYKQTQTTQHRGTSEHIILKD